MPLAAFLHQPLPACKYLSQKGALTPTSSYNSFPLTVTEWGDAEELIIGDLPAMATGLAVKLYPLFKGIPIMSSQRALTQAWFVNVTHPINLIMMQRQQQQLEPLPTYCWMTEPSGQLVQQQRTQEEGRQVLDAKKPDMALLCQESYQCVTFAELRRR